MKRSLFAILLVATFPCFVKAQVTLQPSIPAVGLIQKNQLWNVLLINSSTKQYDCRLELVLRDRATGQEIMTASSGQFTMPPGSKQLNVNIVAPVQYNYILAGIDNKMQGLLPAGLYTACYSLVSTTIKEADLAQECVQFDTEPLTPPMLIQPADSSILEMAPNQFSWIPPTPDGMFDRLQYDVVITEINEGQKANEAIEENLPFYNEGNHIANMLSYPASSPSFEKDKWYAWQVVARDNRNYAGKSEVWVFKVATTKQSDSSAINYVLLKNSATDQGVYHLNEEELNIKFYSFDKPYTAAIKIKQSNGRQVRELQQNIVYGDNVFTIKLNRSFQQQQLYVIELIDAKGVLHKALFTIIK